MRHYITFFAAMAVGLAANALPAATVETFTLTAEDGAEGDLLGQAVDVYGTTAIVGAAADDGGTGSAYLFDTETGQQITKLAIDDGLGSTYYGAAVAISETRAIVGSSNGGLTYLFDTSTLQQITALTETNGSYISSAQSIDIYKNIAIIGTPLASGTSSQSGAAYLFDVTTGEQISKLTADDGAYFDLFGGSVAISGDLAIVSAQADDDNGSNSGSAYIFDITTGQQITKLTADDGAANDYFGTDVAISDGYAVVSAYGTNGNMGTAYIFDIETGEQITKFSTTDGSYSVRDVIVTDTTLIVSGGNSVNLFDIATGEHLEKITHSGGYFGYSIALSGTTLIVGDPYTDYGTNNSGSAYIYDISNLTTVAPVPLPAGTWLLGSALGLGALARRRRG